MSRSRLFALLPLVLASLAGCQPPALVEEATTGSIRMSVSLPSSAPGEVSRISVTVSAPDMASNTFDLTLTGGVWGGVLQGLPAGQARVFVAQAFDASNTRRYEGRVTGVTITAGVTGQVSLSLQDVAPSPPYSNETPILDSLLASTTQVAPGGNVSLLASAHDPDSGDTVSYAWTAPAGSFASPSQASTTWTAPSTPGPVTLTLTVSDSRGASLTATLTLTVSASTGATDVGRDTP